MKIYAGNNKKEAKQMSFRWIMDMFLGVNLEEKGIIVTKNNSTDNSFATLDIRVPFKNELESGVYDIVINFNPKNLNEPTDVEIYKSLLVLDEQNMKKLA